MHTLGNLYGYAPYLGGAWASDTNKPDLVFTIFHIGAIAQLAVQVNIKIQGRSEALNESHSTGIIGLSIKGLSPTPFCLIPQVRKQRACECCNHEV